MGNSFDLLSTRYLIQYKFLYLVLIKTGNSLVAVAMMVAIMVVMN